MDATTVMTADWIAGAYFAYLALAAWLVPRTPVRRRLAVSAAALALAALVQGMATWQPFGPAWHAWLPVLWLVVGYWLPAGLWRGPMPRAEAWLLASDRWLTRLGSVRSDDAARAASVAGAARPLLEAAYLLVHPIVPAAWLVLLLGGHAALADRFWSATLLAGYACYGTLPWIQTRPPRLLALAFTPAAAAPALHQEDAALDQGDAAHRSRLRRLNIRLLDLVSVKANTFPSGHTAVVTVVSLCVLSAMPAAGLPFVILAVLIAIATVVCRYHYTVDTLLGLAIGLLAWALVWSRP